MLFVVMSNRDTTDSFFKNKLRYIFYHLFSCQINNKVASVSQITNLPKNWVGSVHMRATLKALLVWDDIADSDSVNGRLGLMWNPRLSSG